MGRSDIGPRPVDVELSRLVTEPSVARRTESLKQRLRKIWLYRYIYLLMTPGLLFFIIFHYIPMWGVIIAFQDFRPWFGLFNSPWVGFENFAIFFKSIYFVRLVRNTLTISILNLLFVFPAPIVLALLLNEVRAAWFKRIVQTVSYLPHFVSWVVVGGLLIYIFSINVGIVNLQLARMDLEPIKVLANPRAFLPLIIGSGIWKNVGWGAIIYLAAIAGISPELYEAATVDGANRFQRAIYITIPSITPVIVIMLILRIGAILNVNFQQILILMGNDATLFEIGDVIQTWVYRTGFYQMDFGLATAVGLLRGVIGLVLVWAANRIANRLTESGLW